MKGRTDLIAELQKDTEKSLYFEENFGQIKVFFSTLDEKNEYKKPKGKYATVELGNVERLTDYKMAEKAIIFCLRKLFLSMPEKTLIVGLGNREITSDCIGPHTAENILATRHIMGEFAKNSGLEKLKSVSVIEPSVLGKTGIETVETVSAVVDKIKPDAVIVIDALCAKNCENLFSVIQFCDSGITPGSGVKNARKELSYNTLGVPTVAIGVPTVVEADSITEASCENLLVTPKDADLLSRHISEILAQALNVFLQPDCDRNIILNLV